MVRRARASLILAAVLAAESLQTARAVSPPSPACTPRTSPAAVGFRRPPVGAPVAGQPRATYWTFSSGALGRDVHADVLLPPGYDAKATTRYPVLFLLHGHGGSAKDWLDAKHGNTEALLGDTPVIVVMPDGGYDGWYSDWYGKDVTDQSPEPAPGWETFHLRELLPWLDATYRTIPDRLHRAVAGNSMGGFGAMSYGARHPDLFVAAAAFSGALEPDLAYPAGPVGTTIASNLPDGKPPDGCIWGDPVTQDVVWRDHDPTELATNLRGLSLFLAVGDGTPGRHDEGKAPTSLAGAAFTEWGVSQMSHDFDRALTAAAIPHTTWFYGAGTHDWPYWRDDLARFVPQLRAAFATPPPAPPATTFSYETAAPSFSVWGWTFIAADRKAATEMTYLDGVGPRGLDARGSGTLVVATGGVLTPGRHYRVDGAGGRTLDLTADPAGRIAFKVDLGPVRPVQQTLFGPVAEQTFTSRHVTITPS